MVTCATGGLLGPERLHGDQTSRSSRIHDQRQVTSVAVLTLVAPVPCSSALTPTVDREVAVGPVNWADSHDTSTSSLTSARRAAARNGAGRCPVIARFLLNVAAAFSPLVLLARLDQAP